MDAVFDRDAAEVRQQQLHKSYVTVTARVNAATKKSAQSILESKGLTISTVVQRTLENIARTGEIPAAESREDALSKEEIVRRLKAVRAFELAKPLKLTDDEIREMRLEERYGLDFDA